MQVTDGIRIWPVGLVLLALATGWISTTVGWATPTVFRQFLFNGWIGALSSLALGMMWPGLARSRIALLTLSGGIINLVSVKMTWVLGGWAAASNLSWMIAPWTVTALSALGTLAIANLLCERRTSRAAALIAVVGALVGMTVFMLARMWAGLAAWQFAATWALWIVAVSGAHAICPPKPVLHART